MKISELQKLDFLLQIVNAHSDSKEFKLVFGLKGNTYSGNFVPDLKTDFALRRFYIKLLDLSGLSDLHEESYEESFKYINVTNNEWKSFTTHYSGELGKTDLGILIKASNRLLSVDYLRLLDEILETYNIEFNDTLPPYIYNVKSLTTQLPINFMKVDKDTDFDFISLVSQNAI
ncbi:hypothetical protein QI209_09150 [Staphylococcus saprophyticus]|nr:hypothetical protein [Staphylococcus saprophyticus]